MKIDNKVLLKSPINGENQSLSVKGTEIKQNIFTNILKFCIVFIFLCVSCEIIIAQVQQKTRATETIVRDKKHPFVVEHETYSYYGEKTIICGKDSGRGMIINFMVAAIIGLLFWGINSLYKSARNANTNKRLNEVGETLDQGVKYLIDSAIKDGAKHTLNYILEYIASSVIKNRQNAIEYFLGKLNVEGRQLADESDVKEIIGDFVNKKAENVQTARYAGQDGYHIIKEYWNRGVEMVTLNRESKTIDVPLKNVEKTGEYETREYINKMVVLHAMKNSNAEHLVE